MTCLNSDVNPEMKNLNEKNTDHPSKREIYETKRLIDLLYEAEIRIKNLNSHVNALHVYECPRTGLPEDSLACYRCWEIVL